MQARIALEHGKRVFLVHGLVTREPWAQRYRDHAGASEVSSVDDVLDVIDRPGAEPLSAAHAGRLSRRCPRADCAGDSPTRTCRCTCRRRLRGRASAGSATARERRLSALLVVQRDAAGRSTHPLTLVVPVSLTRTDMDAQLHNVLRDYKSRPTDDAVRGAAPAARRRAPAPLPRRPRRLHRARGRTTAIDAITVVPRRAGAPAQHPLEQAIGLATLTLLDTRAAARPRTGRRSAGTRPPTTASSANRGRGGQTRAARRRHAHVRREAAVSRVGAHARRGDRRRRGSCSAA